MQHIAFPCLSRSGHCGVINWVARSIAYEGKHGAHLVSVTPETHDHSYEKVEFPRASEIWWYDGDNLAFRHDHLYYKYMRHSRGEPLGEMCGEPNDPIRPIDFLLSSFENIPPERIEFANEKWGRPVVYILRSLENWSSSILHREAHHPNTWQEPYEDMANRILAGATHIIYDHWFTSSKYREYVCEQLDIPFHDVGLNEVLNIGGGSSFSQLKHKNSAQKMDVLNRKKRLTSKVTRQLEEFLEKNKGLVELSDAVIAAGLEHT